MTEQPTPTPTSTPSVSSPRIYSGNEANQLVRNLVLRRKQRLVSGDSVITGIPFMDSINPPMTRGDMGLVVGLTSEGKSMLANTMVMNMLDEMERGQRSAKGGVVVILTESTVEKRRIETWGDHRVSMFTALTGTASLEVVEENIVRTKDQPLYFVGDTAGGEDTVDFANDDTFGTLTMARIGAAIQTIVKSGVEPELVVLDHVHEVSPEKDTTNEHEMYELISRQAVRLARWLRRYCPFLVLAQAKKEVMQRPAKDRMPTKYDLLYMGALSRYARDMYSIWYPASHMKDKDVIETSKGLVNAAKGVFVVGMVKARDGEALNKTFPMTAIGKNGEWSHKLTEMPLQTISLNGNGDHNGNSNGNGHRRETIPDDYFAR